jgi:hypothetical protein
LVTKLGLLVHMLIRDIRQGRLRRIQSGSYPHDRDAVHWVKTTLDDKQLVSVSASHELVEMPMPANRKPFVLISLAGVPHTSVDAVGAGLMKEILLDQVRRGAHHKTGLGTASRRPSLGSSFERPASDGFSWMEPPCDASDDEARVCFHALKFIPTVIDHEENVNGRLERGDHLERHGAGAIGIHCICASDGQLEYRAV